MEIDSSRVSWRQSLPSFFIGAANRLRGYVRDVPEIPPREKVVDRFLFGLAQPLIGLRIVVRDSELLKSALIPAVVLGLFCALVASTTAHGSAHRFFTRFYALFAALAPAPSIIFARHYSRLAAAAYHKLGFGHCLPRKEPLGYVIRRAVYQAVLIVIVSAPTVGILRLFPLLGRPLAALAAALWAIHWVIINAFDDARVLHQGETLEDEERKNESAPQAWFVRALYWAAQRLPFGARLLRFYARRCDRLSVPWREEMAFAEGEPPAVIGFGLTTAALLATPVLNLLFRPIIIVASVHLIGHLSGSLETDASKGLLRQ
ncbi:MAG TPA: hypothetical protein VFV14_10960 [Myxococcaceae bacterium]|nr:hypothetical protein [Myxococcaceae bacterium]